MKHILIFILFLLLLSCSSVITDNKDDFIYDIIQNPSKVKDLKKYYPDRINDTLIDPFMLDPKYIENIEERIIKFNLNWCPTRIFRFDSLTDKALLDRFNKLKLCKRTLYTKDFIVYSLLNSEYYFDVWLIKEKNMNYLYYIMVTKRFLEI